MTKSETVKLKQLVREMFDLEREWHQESMADKRAMAFGRLCAAKDKLKEAIGWTSGSSQL